MDKGLDLELRDRLPYTRDLPQMGAIALIGWKERIANFQQRVRSISIPEQQTLFTLNDGDKDRDWDPDRVDPFDLPPYNFTFYDIAHQPVPETPSIYFAIDSLSQILLYVGEALNPKQRWQGEHDCKRYVRNYVLLHRQCDLDVRLATAIWSGGVYAQTRQRQKQERHLIEKWRSPFNKENWHFWGTPFLGGR